MSMTPDCDSLSLELVNIWSNMVEVLFVILVGEWIICLRPWSEHISLYGFASLDLSSMLKSPKIYTSQLLILLILSKASENWSLKSALSGGLYMIPINIGLGLGRSISKMIFSMQSESTSLTLKDISFLI